MAFANKFGNLVNYALNSTPWSFQSIRCMTSSKVFVGGLSDTTNAQSLKDAFSSCGKVINANVIMVPETGESRRFGFVTFSSEVEASNAISRMDGEEVDGCNVRVRNAVAKRDLLYNDKLLDFHYTNCLPWVDGILKLFGFHRGSRLDRELRKAWLTTHAGYKFD